MKRALVIIFDKVEELEALAPIDILRRAGVDVTSAAMGKSLDVRGRSAIRLFADKLFCDVKDEIFDAIVVSGGPGTYDIINDEDLLCAIRRHHKDGKIAAAICAAPLVLKRAGILESVECTGHTSILEKLENSRPECAVVCDKNVISSQGAGSAVEFALALAKEIMGEKIANDVAKSICFVK